MPRRKLPSATVSTKFEAALQSLSTEFFRTSTFKHAATRGSERELPVQDFLRNHLPHTFRVGRGEVVDVYDAHGPQLDVVVYDALRNYAFHDGDSLLLPAEALLVSVEVKSVLSRAEIEKSLEAASKLKKLRPFRAALPQDVNRDGQARNYPCRYFHCVFAYKSDLAEDAWAESEYTRFTDVATALSISPNVIDRVYVVNRGLLNVPFESAITEKDGSGLGLLHFYMHILNFLSRENAARDAVPYLEYAGRLTKGWKKLR